MAMTLITMLFIALLSRLQIETLSFRFFSTTATEPGNSFFNYFLHSFFFKGSILSPLRSQVFQISSGARA